ncbi:MAG: rod shape-determining protein MreC [bacterium]
MRRPRLIPERRRDEAVLGFLVVLGILLAGLPKGDTSRFAHDLIAYGNDAVLETFDWAFELAYLACENTELRRRNAELGLENTRLREAERQNQRLRSLLEFEQQRGEEILLGAEVVGWGDGRRTHTVTIRAGAAEGVERYMAVVTADGLVGRVDRLPGSRHAIVSLLSDPANAVAAVVERTREQGYFQFVGDQGRLHQVLQSADVMVGDRVLSSGLGGVYPEGLFIGTVTAVTDDPDGVTKRVVVEPAAALDRLEEVFVLRRED